MRCQCVRAHSCTLLRTTAHANVRSDCTTLHHHCPPSSPYRYHLSLDFAKRHSQRHTCMMATPNSNAKCPPLANITPSYARVLSETRTDPGSNYIPLRSIWLPIRFPPLRPPCCLLSDKEPQHPKNYTHAPQCPNTAMYHLSHTHSRIDTRSCGSLSNMHCNMAKGCGCYKNPEGPFRLLVEPWVVLKNHGCSLMRTKGPGCR